MYHANYVERLRDSGVKYSWSCEPVYGLHKGENRIVGAKGTITIEDMGSYDGFGDIDTFKLDSPKHNDLALISKRRRGVTHSKEHVCVSV